MQSTQVQTAVTTVTIETGLPPTDRRPSPCSQWRVFFGSRWVAWPRSIRSGTAMAYSAIFSQCPA